MKKRHLQTFSLLPKLIGLALALSIVSCNSAENNKDKDQDQELPTMTLQAVKSEVRDGKNQQNQLLVWELEITAGVIEIADYTSKIIIECFVNEDYTMLDQTKSVTAPLPLTSSLPGVTQLKKGDKKRLLYAAIPVAIGASKSIKLQWEIQDKRGKTVAGPATVQWTVAA